MVLPQNPIITIVLGGGVEPSRCNGLGVSATNYSGNLKQNPYPNLAPLDKDTVNFKGQDTAQTKKKGMSGFAKICLGLLGIGAVAYAGVVTHRVKTKPAIDKIAQNFSEIFRKDVSKEEATKIAEQYKEIFQTKDKDEFIQKCFNQAKKDFGYENIDIKIGKLSKTDIDKAAKEGYELGGGYRPLGVVFGKSDKAGTMITLNDTVIEINPNNSKEQIFKDIIHELTHAKQHEMAYRVDKQGFYDAIKEARFSNLKEKTLL